MNNLNLASIYIKKVNFGKNVIQVSQIALIYQENNKLECMHYYIKNSTKQAFNSVDLKSALSEIYKIIYDKKIILKNTNNEDLSYLIRAYKALKINFNNLIFDVYKKAKSLGINNTNLANLCHVYGVASKNTKSIPYALFKARQLYLVAIKMFNLDNDE